MSVYQDVTAAIITELEKGALPWVKPWRADMSADKNIITGAAYRGINRLLLGMSAMAKGHTSNEWGTFKQWQEKGYQVQKGEKSTRIVFFKNVAGKETPEGDIEGGYAMIKAYAVFNAQQTNKEVEETAAAPVAGFFLANAEERIIVPIKMTLESMVAFGLGIFVLLLVSIYATKHREENKDASNKNEHAA